jgi:hypothetical protein
VGKREDEELEDHEVPPVMNVRMERTSEFSHSDDWAKLDRERREPKRER